MAEIPVAPCITVSVVFPIPQFPVRQVTRSFEHDKSHATQADFQSKCSPNRGIAPRDSRDGQEVVVRIVGIINLSRQCLKVKTNLKHANEQTTGNINRRMEGNYASAGDQRVLGIENETPEEFADMVYGVKFAFTSGSPGYVGDIFILQGGYLNWRFSVCPLET